MECPVNANIPGPSLQSFVPRISDEIGTIVPVAENIGDIFKINETLKFFKLKYYSPKG